jgi:hypothetical protein
MHTLEVIDQLHVSATLSEAVEKRAVPAAAENGTPASCGSSVY